MILGTIPRVMGVEIMGDKRMTFEEWKEKHSDLIENVAITFFYYGKGVDTKTCYDELEYLLKRAFKAGRPKWHKVADGDLPKEPEFLKNDLDNHRYEWYIVASVGKPSRALYSFAKKKWFIDYEEMMIGTNYFEPIAWCEFPEYTEE